MDQLSLEGVDLHRAGSEYAEALAKLGFEPDVVAWGMRDEAWTLVLLSSWVDRFGRRELYDLLFEAYDASATPKEINPFIVTALSPDSQGGRQLVGMIGTMRDKIAEGVLPDDRGTIFVLGMGEVMVYGGLVIRARHPRTRGAEDMRRFSRFRSKVHALAA